MSVLSFPRINFKGTIQLNPGTANNDDYAGAHMDFFSHPSKTAIARTGDPVPPRILSGRPIKRKRPRPMS